VSQDSARGVPEQPGNFTAPERALVDVQLAPAKVLPMTGRAG